MKGAKEVLVGKIEVPQGVSVQANDTDVKVSCAGISNTRHFKCHGVSIRQSGNALEVYALDQRRDVLAEAGSVVSHIRNMVLGTQKTFEARLEIAYSHFPINVASKGNVVEVNNLIGQKSPKKAKMRGNTKVEVKGKEIVVKGNNKEDVAQTAANIEQVTRPRGKDPRIFSDGIYITQRVKAV